MIKNLRAYENRIARLRHRLKHLSKDINEFKELSKKIAKLSKIIKQKKAEKGI